MAIIGCKTLSIATLFGQNVYALLETKPKLPMCYSTEGTPWCYWGKYIYIVVLLDELHMGWSFFQIAVELSH